MGSSITLKAMLSAKADMWIEASTRGYLRGESMVSHGKRREANWR